jgi:hypothetical protein
MKQTAREMIEQRLAAPADRAEEMGIWAEQIEAAIDGLTGLLNQVRRAAHQDIEANQLYDGLEAARAAMDDFAGLLDLPAFDRFFHTASGGGESFEIFLERNPDAALWEERLAHMNDWELEAA